MLEAVCLHVGIHEVQAQHVDDHSLGEPMSSHHLFGQPVAFFGEVDLPTRAVCD